MARMTKYEVQRAIEAATEMLERNACPIDTFEGVLNRRYIKNLRLLIGLGERCLKSRIPARQPARQSTKK